MSFIRPEAAQWLHRWRETLAGAAAAGLGVYWTVADNGALTIIGTVLTIGGALLFFAGVQRARFRRGAARVCLSRHDAGGGDRERYAVFCSYRSFGYAAGGDRCGGGCGLALGQ